LHVQSQVTTDTSVDDANPLPSRSRVGGPVCNYAISQNGGGTDGSRPRGHLRDSPPFLRFFNDLQTRGERLRPPKSYKTWYFVDRFVDQVFQLSYASSSVSALLCWQQLSQRVLVWKAAFRPCGSSAGVIECIDDWALADELREIAGRKPVCTGTDRGLLRSVLGPRSPVPKCEAPEAPISVEEHTSMAPRPRRQSQNPRLQKSFAVPACR
jgi:hypothetical protein